MADSNRQKSGADITEPGAGDTVDEPGAGAAPAPPRPRHLGALVAGLLVALLAFPVLAQAVYTWTDDDGVQQYTDDPQSIPQKHRQKARTTSGDDISVMGRGATPSPPAARPAERTQPPPAGEGPSRCMALKKQITRTEADLARRKEEYEQKKKSCEQTAARMTRSGRLIPARGCTGSSGPDRIKDKVIELERRLEDERDALRVAQLQGC